MVPNPFFAKVIVKVISIVTKSAIKAYSNTLKKNNTASGKKAFKFDWNDIFKHNKFNMLNYIDISKLKSYNPFEKSQDKVAENSSKHNIHKISKFEALKILAIDAEKKLSLQLIMEQYLFLYTKNKPEMGGSAYLQAKIMNAKDMLIEEFGGTNEELNWRNANGFLDDDNTVFEKKAKTKQEEEQEEAEAAAAAAAAETAANADTASSNKEDVQQKEDASQNMKEGDKQEQPTDKEGKQKEEEESSDDEEEKEEEKKEGENKEDDSDIPKEERDQVDRELKLFAENHLKEENEVEIEETKEEIELKELVQQLEELKKKKKK